jgi:hypothetical protein
MKTFDEWKEIANNIHNNKYEYVELIKCKKDYCFVITCKIHGNFTKKIQNHTLKKQGCPLCSKPAKLTKETLTRSPKVEFKIDDTIGTYRFGQEKKAYDLVNISIPDIIQKHIDKLNDKSINYVTIIKYDHGTRHHIPWHSDKQEGTISAGAKDIEKETNIYNINVFRGINRLFQVAKPEFIDKTKASVYEFNERMEHGSLFSLTAEGNRTMKHQVPKEKEWIGCRYSIVLRAIKNNNK